jgi:hypothetical protein
MPKCYEGGLIVMAEQQIVMYTAIGKSTATPVIVIGGDVVSGFDPTRLEHLLPIIT